MATTEHFYTGNNSTTDYSFTFPYLKTDDIKVSLDAVATTAYTLPNSTTVRFNTAPGTGVDIHIYRDTDVDTAKAVFAAGSSVRAVDLNNNEDQALYSLQENQGQLVKTTDIKDSAVNSAKILDGTIVNADINASAAIAGTKVSPNFGSQAVSTSGTASTGALGVTGNITVSGTVDGRDVASDGTKLDGIETAATADQTNAEIRAAVEAASDSNVFTDADHTKLNAIESGATADQTNAEIRAAVEAATDSNVFTDADHTKLNGIETAATADQTASEIKSLIASSPLDASHLAADSVTTSEIADAELTTLAGMQSGTASILASSTALTSTTAELNLLDGKSIVTSVSGSSTDVQIPSAKAVNDQILSVTNALGGFVAIANETSFPATNPDPSDGAGTVVSISDAGGVVVNGSGVASITNGAGSGNTVTINGFPSSLYSKTLAAGVGLQVQTTTTLHTYDYHKILAKEADVEQLSGDINDFNERYRIASSAPGSDNDEGDLYFDTSTNKMMVYDGSAWGEVASTGSFYINTLSSSSGTPGTGGSATFNGSANQFTLSNPPTSAEQLIVSINGVVQKPNSGSSVPSEGFAISGSDIIFSSAPASSSDFFIITIGASVSIGTPSSNTVSTSTIQNLAVTNDKIANDTIAEVKLDISNTASDGQFLQYKDSSDKLTWASVSSTPEGEAIQSTTNSNEASTKFLRADGDGTCSWQIPTDTNTQLAFANDANNRVVTGDGSGGLNGEANLTYDGTNLTLTTDADGEGIVVSNSGNTYNQFTFDADRSSATNPVGAIFAKWDGNTIGSVQWNAGTDTTNKDDGYFDLRTAEGGTNTERVRVHQGGNVEIKTGNLIIGTSGKGIDFSATSHATGMTSELLDSYEEGAWTPSITNTTNTGTTVGRVCKYRKIGKLVFATFDFYQSSNNMGLNINGNSVISGLPFAAEGSLNSTNSISTYTSSGGGTVLKNYIDSTPYIIFSSNGELTGIRHLWGHVMYPTSS